MSRLLYYSPITSSVHDNIYDLCCQNIKQGRRVIYIAPSRELIFKVRKDISSIMGGLINMDVMSFDDLEMEILKCGSRSGYAADSSALSIILSGVLEKLACRNSLSFFASVLDKPGFVEGCLRAIRRLKRSMAFPDDLKKIMEELNEQRELSLKLADLEIIYRAYDSELKRLRIKDSEDLAIDAVGLSGNSSLFSSMGLMVVDGFIDIDSINMGLLKNIADAFPQADYICSVPFNAPSSREFVESHIIKDLCSMGFILNETDVNYTSGPLEGLFSVNSARSCDASGICINNYPCIEDEVRGAARRIKQLVMSGEKPDRMAVVITSDNDYRDVLPDIFSEMGLPLDMGQRIPLSSHPVARDLWTLLTLKLRGMSMEGLIGVVSSRYFTLVPLEQQKGAEEALRKLYDGEDTMEALDAAALSPENNGCTEEQLKWAKIGYNRAEDIISQLPDEGVIGDFVEKLAGLLDSYKIRENLVRMYKAGVISSELFIRDVKGHFSIMETLSAISSLYQLAGADKRTISFREFASIINESLRKQTITLAQRGREGIKAIKPDVFRGVEYDYVFFLGLNEGVYPKPSSKGGLFTLREREALERYGLDLGCRTLELSRSKIAFMLACCSAKKKLFLSYRTTGEDGSYMIKSPFLEELEGLFEKDEIEKVTGEKRCMRQRFEASPDEIWSVDEAIDSILINDWQKKSPDMGLEPLRRTLMLKGMDKGLKELNQLGEIEKTRQQGDTFDRYDGLITGIQTAQSRSGYCFSASQINSYASCPFKYYMERILGISTYEDEGEFNSISEGTLYHEVLRFYYENAEDLYTLDKPLLKKGIDMALERINDRRLVDIVRRTKVDEIRVTLEQFLLKDIDFFTGYRNSTGRELRPTYLEFKVNETEAFRPYLFTANIDRVDLEYEEDKPTGRFIMYDYKKKNKKSTRDCLGGRDFQLAVYYQCIQKELKKKLPQVPLECLGLLYYAIEKPDRDGLIRDEYKKPLGKSRKLDTLCGVAFTTSMEFLDDKIKELSSRIASGNFTLKDSCPLDGTGFQCEFYQACRFDRYRIRNKRR
jgi:ATP-dependent helicase/DNAse subunit B